MTRRIEANLLRAAVQGAHLGLWAWDIAADEMRVSTGWKRQLGETDGRLVFPRSEFEARVHPDDLAEVRRHLEAYLAGATEDCRAELRLRHADGSWRWMLALGSRVGDGKSRPLHVAGSHVDITEQKATAAELARANQELRARNQQLEAAERLARLGHWERDLDTDEVTWSRQACRFLGWPPGPEPSGERRGAGASEPVHPDDRERLLRAIAAARDGAPLDLDYRVVRADGEVLAVHSQGTVVRGADGRPRRLVGVVQDVSERKRVEESLRAAERQLRTIVDGVPDFISRFDTAGRFLYLSGSVERQMGVRAEAIAGKTAVELGICATPEGDRALEESLARVTASGCPEELEIELATPSGPRPFEIRHIPEKNEQGAVVSVLGIARDLSERKAAARQLSVLNYALDHVSDAIFLMEGDSAQFVYVNQSAADSLGYSRAELTGGMGVFDIDPEWTAERWAQFVPVIRARRQLTIETLHRRRDGATFPVEITGNYFELNGQALNMAIARDIRERRAAEAALRESEELHRSLVTAMAEGMVLQDANGRVTAVNPAAERIEGRRAAELLGRYAHALTRGAIRHDGAPFPPDEHPSLVSLRTGEPRSNVVMGIRRPDGTRAWISINAQPLVRPGEARPYAAVTTFHDITALEDSERQLRTLAENSPDVILRFDQSGRRVFANRAFEQLLVASAPDAGRDADLLERALVPRVHEVCAAGVASETEIALALAGGEHTLDVRLVPEADDEGRVGSVLAVIRDVTEARRFSVQLAAREAHLRAVIETAVDAIITIDERGTIEHANSAAVRMFGHPIAELIGRNVKILMNDEDAARHDGYLERAVRLGGRSLVLGRGREVTARRRDGTTFPADLSVSEFFVGTSRRYTGMLRDISERKRFERMLAEGELRLRTSVAYELHDSVGQLLAGGRFLAQNLVADLPGELRPRATRIVEILSDTLAKIRAFSKNLEVLGTASFSFTQALGSLREKISAVYDLDSRVELETHEEPALTQRRQAYLVVEEAVANAIRHSGCRRIVLRFGEHGGRYHLCIEDDGVGIADERATGGMGLTTMRYRAQLLGGSLEVVRREPQGTAVILEWPVDGEGGEQRVA